jgi:YesN/AraC family two-component response regulator
LIISDVMMPLLDGLELCRSIKSDPGLHHIPVILLTARADEESRLEGLETGADDYLAKPFNSEELLARVENLIKIRGTLRAHFGGQVVVGASQVVVTSSERAFMEQVRDAIEARLSDTSFGVDELADDVGLSTRQLLRRLRETAGVTPGGYIRMLRLERAAQLLEQRAGNVSEIAYQVGFKQPEYFSKLFRQVFGVPPSAYPSNHA